MPQYNYKRITDDDLRRAGEEVQKGVKAVQQFANDADYARRQFNNKTNKKVNDISKQVSRTGKEWEKNARDNVKTSNVPSTRPDYSGMSVNGSSGKEWDNHKYIDKVKTKSGKIRYIYEDVDTASGRHKNVAGQFKDKKQANLKAIADAQERRQKQEYYDKHPVEKTMKVAKDTVDNIAKSGRDFIDNTVKAFMDTPVAQLFKR